MTHDELDDGRHREGRRSFLKKVGVGAAVAWTAPTIASTRALAQSTCGISGPNDITNLLAWWDAADPTTIN
ncbi:twin-arginine translocation signal domain-containing protein, partial [Rhabdothermincola sp.]|uniref:twin-arginine translocation signal domain-containing protein n=1 Tax=Rhabdothermincola sp. TaxID=2820405 RepID=UPI002FE01420